jgi:hypothetical protein
MVLVSTGRCFNGSLLELAVQALQGCEVYMMQGKDLARWETCSAMPLQCPWLLCSA